MLYPQSLRQGNSIAIIAPSGVVNAGYVQQTKNLLEQWGLNVVLSKNLFAEYGRFAGTIQERLTDLQNYLDDPQIQAVFCARGGYGVVHLLENLSLEKFKKHPKWVVGYSDITALHLLFSLSGVCSLHAPMSSHLAEEGEDESVLALKNILFGTLPTYLFSGHPLNRPGSCDGFVRGGNLSVIQSLCGTPYQLLTKDTILFIEDISEKPYHIERMMYHLKLSGVLSKISGLIVGKFTDCEEDPLMNGSIYESIMRLVSEYDYPVCFNYPVGHEKENFPLIENGKARFSVNKTGVSLEYQSHFIP